MNERLEILKRVVAFDESDCRRLRALGDPLAKSIPRVVELFYDRIMADPEARAVLSGGPQQWSRLRASLEAWLRDLFNGDFGDEYFARRSAVGRVHVRVALPQRLMISAMDVIRQGLTQAMVLAGVPDLEASIESLSKLLNLELSAMLETFKEDYSTRVREVEHDLMEERLTRAEHLAEIGQLAASLAHEIKNPLAGISGAIQIIRENMAEEDPHREIIGEILEQIGRLDAAVKDLLLYARPAAPRPKRFELGMVVRRILSVLRTEPALAGLKVDDANLHSGTVISADEGQIEQLLINLIINAAHASRPGGMIRIRASGEGDTVRLAVIDEGRGMTEEVRRKALEPFFTTKAKGTGLGLSICRRIAEAHGGGITIESELNKGTRVTVELPSSPPAGQRSQPQLAET